MSLRLTRCQIGVAGAPKCKRHSREQGQLSKAYTWSAPTCAMARAVHRSRLLVVPDLRRIIAGAITLCRSPSWRSRGLCRPSERGVVWRKPSDSSRRARMLREPGEGNPEALERLQAATQRAATQDSGKKCNRFSKELNQRKGRTKRRARGREAEDRCQHERGVSDTRTQGGVQRAPGSSGRGDRKMECFL